MTPTDSLDVFEARLLAELRRHVGAPRRSRFGRNNALALVRLYRRAVDQLNRTRKVHGAPGTVTLDHGDADTLG